MFTGIIQSIGKVVALKRAADGAELVIDTGLAAKDIALGDSIAVDGCCQTVAKAEGGVCHFHVLNETLSRTVFGEYRAGRKVNIEPALRLGDRLGGHIVSGHIDCTAEVLSVRDRKGDIALTLARPPADAFPLVPKGSIAIDGVSLTVAELTDKAVTVCLIPHTWSHTALNMLSAGAKVNLEADLVGKYVAALAAPYAAPSRVTMEMLTQAGFR